MIHKFKQSITFVTAMVVLISDPKICKIFFSIYSIVLIVIWKGSVRRVISQLIHCGFFI